MEISPPPPPPPRRRLGLATSIVVLAPIVLLLLGMAVVQGLHLKEAEGYFTLVFALACLCSVGGAIMICLAAESIVPRILLFVLSGGLLMVLYTTCIFAGCSAVSGPMNFH